MAIRLSGDDSQKLRDMLCRQPQWRNEAGRIALTDAAFASQQKGIALRNQLHLAGSADESASRFLELVLNFGQVTKGIEALGVLLRYLKDQVGLDDEEFIDQLFDKYPLVKNTPTPSPDLPGPRPAETEQPAVIVPATVIRTPTPAPIVDVLSLPAPMTIAEYKSQMVDIPSGTFMRGSNESDSEKPVRRVTLSAFQMGRTPVTVNMWWEYCKANRKSMPEPPSWGWMEDHPMTWVSWEDAVAYCAWAKVRLPTEAQWEYAAKGGENIKYPWGDEFEEDKLLWRKNSEQQAVPVYRHDHVFVNAFGLIDMSGHVWEWCSDWYDENYYKHLPEIDPSGPSTGSLRIIRGGAWLNDENCFRAAYRGNTSPTAAYTIGFRVSRPHP